MITQPDFRHSIRRALASPCGFDALAVFATSAIAAHPLLSQQEIEVIRLVARGVRTRSAAKRLRVSPRTLEKQRQHIFRKVGIHSVVTLAHYALAAGLVRNVFTADRASIRSHTAFCEVSDCLRPLVNKRWCAVHAQADSKKSREKYQSRHPSAQTRSSKHNPRSAQLKANIKENAK